MTRQGLKRWTSVVVLLTAAFATLAPYHDPAPSASQTQAASAKPQVAISEIWLEEHQVALTNLGSEPVQMKGWFLCNRPGYFRLPDVTLDPGQRVVVHVGVSGVNTARDVFTGSSLSQFSRGADEIALYLDSNFGSANSIVDYVQWGRAGQSLSRESVAIGAGIWSRGAFVDVTALASDQSLYYDGTGDGASDYFVERSALARGQSDAVVVVHSLSGLSLSPGVIWLKAGQEARLTNVAKDGEHNPVQLLDANGNVAFDLSFAVRPGQVESEEFTPIAGAYTLSHQAHGHPIKGTVMVK